MYNVCKVTAPINRICAVQFALGNAIVVLCCIYMPTGLNNCDNIYEYNHILSELTSLYLSIDPSYFIVGGDFNVDVRRPGVCQESTKNFMSAYIFSRSINSNSSDNMYTFQSKSTRCTSVIDYFLCSVGELVECIVFDEVDNLSDHNPVKVVLNIPVVYVNKMSSDNCNTQSKTLWAKDCHLTTLVCTKQTWRNC